jgi:hypothetical protein
MSSGTGQAISLVTGSMASPPGRATARVCGGSTAGLADASQMTASTRDPIAAMISQQAPPGKPVTAVPACDLRIRPAVAVKRAPAVLRGVGRAPRR